MVTGWLFSKRSDHPGPEKISARRFASHYCNFAYFAFAAMKIGMSSASFQSERKSSSRNFCPPAQLLVHVIKYPDTARNFLHGHNQLVVAERKPD